MDRGAENEVPSFQSAKGKLQTLTVLALVTALQQGGVG